MKIKWTTKFLAMPPMVVGVLLTSMSAVAQDPLPFKAMMQSASAPAAVPPMPNANNPGQSAHSGKITPAGKTEIVGGFVLLTTGVATVVLTALLTGNGYAGPKAPALYAGGAAAAGVGVTLIAFGSTRHPKK